jgi:NAD(P)H-hydrate epimerase
MKVLTAAQMREVDRLTTERFGVPGIQLMENAAAAAVNAAEKRFGSFAGSHALIVCGKGNNGGDGAAVARLLHDRRALVTCLLLGRISETTGDARTNFERAMILANTHRDTFTFVEAQTAEDLRRETSGKPFRVCFDAMLGTGLARPAAALYQAAIALINEKRNVCKIVSVDIPSGVPSDTSELIGPSVRAHLTVTFTSPKIGNILPPASHCSDELLVASIGSPDELINSSGSRITFVERTRIAQWLEASRRSPDANKGDVGKVLIVAGSRGKTGAACLAAEAALRSGAGLVTVATAESSQPVVASSVIHECMTEPLAETRSGTIAGEAIERALELAAARDVIAIGPGLGGPGLSDAGEGDSAASEGGSDSFESSTRAFVGEFVEDRERPMVIDADALNALAPWPEHLTGSPRLPLVLTPHPGEMARLVSEKSVAEVLRYRVEIAHEFATTHRVVLVLKGSRSLIASPDGEVYVNSTGNAGMATGGTGDVLTGMIAGFLAQEPDDAVGATIAAVYLHGLAGDIAASRIGLRAIIASDVTACLGEAFIEVGGNAEQATR